MKTTAPLVAAWIEHMNGQLLHSNKLALHHVDEDGNIVRDPLPPEATEFCQNDGRRPCICYAPFKSNFSLVLHLVRAILAVN